MDVNEIYDQVTIDAGQNWLLSSSTFQGTGLGPLFNLLGNDAQLEINGASKEKSDRVFVNGTTAFLGVGGLAARVELKPAGDGLEVNIVVSPAPALAPLPLRDIFARLLPGLPMPPDLNVGRLMIAVPQNGPTSLLAKVVPGSIQRMDVNGAALEFRFDRIWARPPAGGTGRAQFLGSLSIGGREVEAFWESPGEVRIQAELAALNLSDLWRLFDAEGLPAPPGFDIALGNVPVVLEQGADGWRLGADKDVPQLGRVAFSTVIGGSGGAEGGVAVAISLGRYDGSIPGLDFLGHFPRTIELREGILVVSSVDTTGLDLSGLADGVALPASGFTRGFNLYGKLAAHDRGLGALLRLLKVPADGSADTIVAVSLPDPMASTKMSALFDRTIDGVALAGEVGMRLSDGEPAVFLEGTATARVQRQNLVFELGAELLSDGVLISGNCPGGIWFGSLRLDNLGLVLGSGWDGSASLGIMGTISFSNITSSVAVFTDSSDPAKSLVAGSISEAALLEIAEKVAGQTDLSRGLPDAFRSVGLKGTLLFSMPAAGAAAILDSGDPKAVATLFDGHGIPLPTDTSQFLFVRASAGYLWHLTDLRTMTRYSLGLNGDSVDVRLDPQFYFAPLPAKIGKVDFAQGMRLAGEIDLAVLRSRLTLDISPGRGISGQAMLDPITLGFVSLAGAQGQAGPVLSISTIFDSGQPGPRRDPHIVVSAALNILGLKTTTDLQVTGEGLSFSVSEQCSRLLTVTLSGTVNGHAPVLIEAGGTAVMAFGDSLDLLGFGAIALFQPRVALRLSLRAVDSRGEAELEGEVEFVMNGHLPIPEFSLTISGGMFSSLEQEIARRAAKAIQEYFIRAPQEWLRLVADKTISLRNAGLGLKSAIASMGLDGSLKDVAIALQSAAYSVPGIAEKLYGAGYSGGEVVRALQVFNLGDGGSAKAMLGGGLPVEVVGKAIKEVWNISDVGILIWDLKQGGAPAHGVYVLVLELFKDRTLSGMPGLLLWAGYTPREIAQGLSQKADMSFREAWEVASDMRRWNISSNDVAIGIWNAYASATPPIIANTLATALNRAGYKPGEIAIQFMAVGISAKDASTALQGSLGLDFKAAAHYLNQAKYPALDVDRAISDVYKVSIDEVQAILDADLPDLNPF